MGDAVLERNLCFVDTPGYSNKTSVSEAKFPSGTIQTDTSSSWNALLLLLIMSNHNSRKLRHLRTWVSRRQSIC